MKYTLEVYKYCIYLRYINSIYTLWSAALIPFWHLIIVHNKQYVIIVEILKLRLCF